jgi:hypothetical protein
MRCKTCRFWVLHKNPEYTDGIAGGFCENDERLHEADYRRPKYGSDHLVYSYYESGSFWTGPEFGCVHHSTADRESAGTVDATTKA